MRARGQTRTRTLPPPPCHPSRTAPGATPQRCRATPQRCRATPPGDQHAPPAPTPRAHTSSSSRYAASSSSSLLRSAQRAAARSANAAAARCVPGLVTHSAPEKTMRLHRLRCSCAAGDGDEGR
eukprot:6709813-Prymnesium_polylepis.2